MSMKQFRSVGFITFDFIFAIIIVLNMIYLNLLLLSFINKSIFMENNNFENNMKLLLISDKIIKNEVSLKEGPLSYTNIISLPIDIDLEDYYNNFKLNFISVSITSDSLKISEEFGTNLPENKYCIRRIVFIKENKEVGSLDVCIQ